MAEAQLYKGEIPKKYKTPEKEERLFLRVHQPDACPFRIEDQCTLCIEGNNILTGCHNDFARPPSCPLENSDVIITIEKENGRDKNNKEASD
jgi:hypothetical protein